MARARTLWEEGTDPGRQVVVLGSSIVLTAVLLDAVTSGELTWLFDVAFVLACVVVALRIRPVDFYTACVLPPLLMLATLVLLAAVARSVIPSESDSIVQAVVTGLTHHAGALFIGYVLCLGALAMRMHVYGKRREESRPGDLSGTQLLDRDG